MVSKNVEYCNFEGEKIYGGHKKKERGVDLKLLLGAYI